MAEPTNQVVVRSISGSGELVFDESYGWWTVVYQHKAVRNDLDPEIVFRYYNRGPGSDQLPEPDPKVAREMTVFDEIELAELRRRGAIVVVLEQAA